MRCDITETFHSKGFVQMQERHLENLSVRHAYRCDALTAKLGMLLSCGRDKEWDWHTTTEHVGALSTRQLSQRRLGRQQRRIVMPSLVIAIGAMAKDTNRI